MFAILTSCAIAVLCMVLFVWVVSVGLKDASVVDIAWGSGFVVVAWTAYFTTQVFGESIQRLILPAMVNVWGLRLSGYLFFRNHGKPEDYRYRAMRDKWGNSFWWVSLFTVFILQGSLIWIVSLPVQIGIGLPTHNIIWMLVFGVVVWSIGLIFESVGDWQLMQFKANPANEGKVLNSGLWRFTRHPNYFGDFLVWWGIFFVAMSQTLEWWTIISPVAMTVLLMKISGVALLEKSLTTTKPEYAIYAKTTNAFFPWFPKHAS